MENNVTDQKVDNVEKEEENIKVVVDKNNVRYKIALKFLNAILEKAGKGKIDDILEFKGISRADLLKPEIDEIIDAMTDEIFQPGAFNKVAAAFGRRKTTQCYILKLLKYISEEFGYKIKNKKNRIKKPGIVECYVTYDIYKID